jgi:tRNA (cmo5U34)-methyltransferase
METKDVIFASPMERVSDFEFGEDVAEVFDDMLSRSVPFYDEVQCMIVEIIAGLTGRERVVYDLGCSTGTTLLLLARNLGGGSQRLIGVDSSLPMLERAQQKFKRAGLSGAATWVQHDLNQPLAMEPADAVIMNLTLQFIRPLYREQLILNINDCLRRGGCFILVEKVLADNSLLNRTYIDLYHRFKKRKGYSEMEIAQKREALENILVPYRLTENLELLRRGGFAEPEIFFRWYNFAGFVGVKG